MAGPVHVPISTNGSAGGPRE